MKKSLNMLKKKGDFFYMSNRVPDLNLHLINWSIDTNTIVEFEAKLNKDILQKIC